MLVDLTPALGEVVRFMNAQVETRTTEVAAELGITPNAAYKRLYRLRILGVVESRLDWVNFPDGSGCHSPKREDGQVKLMSWLWYSLRPIELWGEEPDCVEIQCLFDPRRNGHQRKGNVNSAHST